MKKPIAFSLSFFAFMFLVKNEILAQPKNIDQSFLGVEKIDLDIGSIGSVELIPSASAEVFVEAYFDEGKIKANVWKEGSILNITDKYKHEKSHDYEQSQWKIMVPKGMKINANIRGGQVEVAPGCSGELNGNCGTGGVAVSEFKGEIKWNCGTGDFHLENCEGEFEMNTGTGNFRLSNVTGNISGNSGTGNFKINNCRGGIMANSGTGDIYASDMAIEEPSSFNSGTGDVEVKLGAYANADLSVNSGTGDAELDMNGQEFNGTLTMICNKKNGKIIAPFSFDKEWTKGSGKREVLYKSKKMGNGDVEVKVGTGSGKAVVE